MGSRKRGGATKPRSETDLKERLNAEIRAVIAAIDGTPAPLRTRVARASEQVIRILMPRAFDEPDNGYGHDAEPRSYLVSFASAPATTVHGAQASVLAKFTRREVLGTTPNTVDQRLFRLHDRLHALVHEVAREHPIRGARGVARRPRASELPCTAPSNLATTEMLAEQAGH